MKRKLSIILDKAEIESRTISVRVVGNVTDETYVGDDGNKYYIVRLTENSAVMDGEQHKNPFRITPDKETGEYLMFIMPNTTADPKNIMYFLQKKGVEPMFISLDDALAEFGEIRNLFKITNTAGNLYGSVVASANETLNSLVGDIANATSEVKMTKAKLVAEVFNHKYMQSVLAEA
jgi:hypothetical protein